MLDKKRLPFTHEIILKSQEIFLNKSTFQMTTWQDLAKKFPNIITAEKEIQFLDELQNFGLDYKSINEKYVGSNLSIVKQWDFLARDYPVMSELALSVLVLPYSTAQVESTFSQFKVFKTPYRNKLSVGSLEASILVEQTLKGNPLTITTNMIERFANMWKVDSRSDKPSNRTISQQKSIESKILEEVDPKEEYSQQKPENELDPIRKVARAQSTTSRSRMVTFKRKI